MKSKAKENQQLTKKGKAGKEKKEMRSNETKEIARVKRNLEIERQQRKRVTLVGTATQLGSFLLFSVFHFYFAESSHFHLLPFVFQVLLCVLHFRNSHSLFSIFLLFESI